MYNPRLTVASRGDDHPNLNLNRPSSASYSQLYSALPSSIEERNRYSTIEAHQEEEKEDEREEEETPPPPPPPPPHSQPCNTPMSPSLPPSHDHTTPHGARFSESVSSSSSSASSLSVSTSQRSSSISQSPNPLTLPKHSTTPSIGSTSESLEREKGINTEKLTPRDFIFGSELGEGSFAKVVIATRKSTQEQFACKIVDKAFITKMGKVQTVMNEKRILTLLHGHVGIVKLAYTFQDQTSLYYVMELAQGGDMFSDIKKVGKYDLPLARFYAAELVEILAFLAESHVLHRDLKPENILFTRDRHIKLTDFGTAKELLPQSSSASASDLAKRRGSFVGTAEFVAPEILRDTFSTGGGIEHAIDWWALGCCLYQMIVGRVPFRGASEYLTFQKILKGKLQFPSTIDPDARDLITQLLVLDPRKRLGSTPTEDLVKIRTHPFFRGVVWETLFDQIVPPRPPVSEVEPESNHIESNDEDDGNEDDNDHDGSHDNDDEAARASDDEFNAKMHALAAEEKERLEMEIEVERKYAESLKQQQELQSQSESESHQSPSSLDPSFPFHALHLSQSSSSSINPSSESTDLVSPLPSFDSDGHVRSVHKTSTDGQYSNSVWARFLQPGENIVYTGLIIKRRALFARKRQLILTDRPRLFYLDPDRMEMKKEIDWSPKLWAEVIDDMTFYVHIPGRDYYMRGLSSSSFCWVKEINDLQLRIQERSNTANSNSYNNK